MLSYDEAKKFYNAFGIKQDKQFYEQSAINALIEHAKMSDAQQIFEFGCGTGKLAQTLLQQHLPKNCRYVGVDISETMLDICSKRLQSFADRTTLIQTQGDLNFDLPQDIDHFISTYVLDLLSTADIKQLIKLAQLALLPGGYFCNAGLGMGKGFVSRIIAHLWHTVFRIRPSLVGGCRPISIIPYFEQDWKMIYVDTIVSYGIPSEIVIVQKK